MEVKRSWWVAWAPQEMDSANRLAAGFCLGCAVGLLPKDSLATWILALMAILSTANLLTGFCGLGLGWLAIPIADRAAIPLGDWILAWPSLHPLLASLASAPLGSWMRIENSAVLGTWLLVLACGGPMYVLVRWGFVRIRSQLQVWMRAHPVTRWLSGQLAA